MIVAWLRTLTCLKPFFERSASATSDVLPEMTRLISTPSTVVGGGAAAAAGEPAGGGGAVDGAAAVAAGADAGADSAAGGAEAAAGAVSLGGLMVVVSIDFLGSPEEKQSKIASARRSRQTAQRERLTGTWGKAEAAAMA